DGVPGVDHVLALRLEADEGDLSCGDLTLCPTWLPASGIHQIDVVSSDTVATLRRPTGIAVCPPDRQAEGLWSNSMWTGLEIPINRPTFRDGQRLASRDLGDLAARQSRLLALHTRFLHDTWGIAVGFELALADAGRAVDLGPGYGVDEQGRGILL